MTRAVHEPAESASTSNHLFSPEGVRFAEESEPSEPITAGLRKELDAFAGLWLSEIAISTVSVRLTFRPHDGGGVPRHVVTLCATACTS